jgi:MFS family permease
MVGLASGLPTTALLLFGGVIADRVDKRRMLFVTQSLFALNAFILAGLTASHAATVWHIVALSFLNGLIFAVDGPTRQALVYDLVGPEDLATGVALQSASFNVARIVGPAIASIIYVGLGPAWCFAVNGLSFAAVLVALTRLKLLRSGPAEHAVSPTAALRAGFTYLRTNRSARTVLSLTAVASVFGVANYGTLMPAIARDNLGILESDRRYGLLFSAIGCGSLIGVYLVGKHSADRRRGFLVCAGAFMFSMALLGLAHAATFGIACIVMVLVGLSAVAQLATANTLTQTLAPEGLRGRAVSLHMFAMGGLQPIGAALAGTVADTYGVGSALILGSVAILAAVVIVMLTRREILSLP